MAAFSSLPMPGKRFVIGVPYVWLFVFFLLPFLILLYISFVDMGGDISPFKPIWDPVTGVLSLKYENYLSIFRTEEGAPLFRTLYIEAYLRSIWYALLTALFCLVDELANVGKGLDGSEFFAGSLFALAEHPGVEIDVFTPGEFGVEARAQLQQRGNPALHLDAAAGGMQGAADHLQQGGFARAVAADDAHRLAFAHLKAHIPQGPELLVVTLWGEADQAAQARQDELTQAMARRGVDLKAF